MEGRHSWLREEENGGEVQDANRVPPCVICGEDIASSSKVVVKREVDGDEIISGGDATAACFGGDPENERKWTEEEKCAYQWFLTWFRLHHILKPKIKRSSRLGNLGWNGDKADPFPFCGECKTQLEGLVTLQKKIEELTEEIQSGVEMLRNKANLKEEVFGKRGIYERDSRYVRFRKYFVADFKTKNSNLPSKNQQQYTTEKTRRSTRNLQEGDVKLEAEDAAIDAELANLLAEPVAGTRNWNALEYSIKARMKAAKNKKDPPKASGTSEEAKDYEAIPSKVMEVDDANDIPSPPEPPEDDGDNWDADWNPESPPAPRKRKRRSVQKPKQYSTADPEEDEEKAASPPKPPSPSTSKRPRRTPVYYKSAEERDQDWQLDKSQDSDNGDPSASDPDSNDDSDEVDDFELDDETGKRRRFKITSNPEKKTLTCKNLVFHQLPTDPNKYSCSECSTLVSRGGVSNHYIKYHTNFYLCKYCDHRAVNRSLLKSHIKSIHKGIRPPNHPKKLTECRICGKPTSTSAIKSHLWSHLSQRERQDAIALGSKAVPAAAEKTFQCESCGKSFSNQSALDAHKLSRHGTPEERERFLELCPECGGTYLDLKRHRQDVHGVGKNASQKSYTCLEDNCGKIFKRLNQLRKHKDSVHRKVRPHKCPMCPREFSNIQSFQKHQNLHLGIRPWQCNFCPSAFSTKSCKIRHIGLYHTEGKAPPKRKPYTRGPTMLGSDVKKRDLVNDGKYLPPSALATWAAGREPTSHFVGGVVPPGPSGVVSLESRDINY